MWETEETWVGSLGREGPLEERMATHSSVPAWRTPRTEEPGGLQPTGLQKNQTWLSTQATPQGSQGSLELDMGFNSATCFQTLN